jgi:hypothetical protein
MRADSDTTSQRRPTRSRCRKYFAPVIGVLLLAVLTNTAVADRGDGGRAHGSGRRGGISVSVDGDGWFISYRHRGQDRFDRGYAAGRAGGGRAGSEDGLRRRRHRPKLHGSLKGRSRDFRRGYHRGFAAGCERGFREGRAPRSAYKRWKRSAHGWVKRPPRGRGRRPLHRRWPH